MKRKGADSGPFLTAMRHKTAPAWRMAGSADTAGTNAVGAVFCYTVQANAISATFGYTVRTNTICTTFGYAVRANAICTTFGNAEALQSTLGATFGDTIDTNTISAIFSDHRSRGLLGGNLRQSERTGGEGGNDEAGENVLFHVRSPEEGGQVTGYGCHVTHAPERQKTHLGIVTIDAVDT